MEELFATLAVQRDNQIADQEYVPATLDKKIQFMYEIAFAKRELVGLGASPKLTLEDTVRFELHRPFDEEYLLHRVAYFERIGERRSEYSDIILPRNVKSSDNQYLTHWFYPYKGKYHPRLVRSIFNIVGLKEGQIVLDSFVGSGTSSFGSSLVGD